MPRKPVLMDCPLCPAKLQPLVASSPHTARAARYARREGVELPAHGPAQLCALALVAHAGLCHGGEDLKGYLEAYANSW